MINYITIIIIIIIVPQISEKAAELIVKPMSVSL